MAKYPLLSTGQQAVTTAAVALPSLAATPGDGLRVILSALKANGASIYYGGPGITTATGDELPAGTSKILHVDNLNQIAVIAAAGGSSVSWAVMTP